MLKTITYWDVIFQGDLSTFNEVDLAYFVGNDIDQALVGMAITVPS